jgi:energy-coupling factor transport system ATP-binding protein
MSRELIAGNNFSGRSEALRRELQRRQEQTFFLGPYAEAALSGLSSTVADEIAIYARAPQHGCFSSIDWTQFGNRKPATLSGGEQVLLALHCFSRSAYRLIGIDTALEQLDGQNRASALDYLSAPHAFDAIVIDNRLQHVPPGWARQDAPATTAEYACDLAGLLPELRPRQAPIITIRAMDFGYAPGRPIFCNVDLSLEPGTAYRLLGPNGAGKSTFFKILVGVLKPARGTILLDDVPYRPRRSGNRVFAFATQNPDHQWCGATLAEDIARRRRALAGCSAMMAPSDALLAAMAHKLGIHSLDLLLYELPLAARKRLSWLWPFSGAMPWLMLDEPTIGQDRATRLGLATIVRRLCELGHGVIVVTHDDDFAASIPHQPLRIEDMSIRAL